MRLVKGGRGGARGRRAHSSLVVAATLWACATAWGDEADAPPGGRAGTPANPFYALDTKNLFGFLEGADVGDKGDRSVEFESTGAFGKPQGRYASIEQEFIFENTLTDSLGLELGAHVLGQDVRGVADLPEFTGVSFMGLSAELRYVVFHRGEALPLQVTLTAQPQWDAIGQAGRRVADFNSTFRAIADWRSADGRLYGAVNFVFTPDGSRLPGRFWEKSSTLSASAALSYRVTAPLMFGAEADYNRAYDHLVPQGFRGQALYLGPTLHYQINEKIDFSAAFLAQAATGALDLADFPRRLAKLKLEVEF